MFVSFLSFFKCQNATVSVNAKINYLVFARVCKYLRLIKYYLENTYVILLIPFSLMLEGVSSLLV